MSSATQKISHGKADFSHLYHRPDPRGYYQNFSDLEYQTPHHGHPIFDTIRHAHRQAMPSASHTVLDVCCSYGVNAALLTTDLKLADLYDRYNQPSMSAETAEQVGAAEDRKSTRLNSSHVAISYAVFCSKKKMLTTRYNQ